MRQRFVFGEALSARSRFVGETFFGDGFGDCFGDLERRRGDLGDFDRRRAGECDLGDFGCCWAVVSAKATAGAGDGGQICSSGSRGGDGARAGCEVVATTPRSTTIVAAAGAARGVLTFIVGARLTEVVVVARGVAAFDTGGARVREERSRAALAAVATFRRTAPVLALAAAAGGLLLRGVVAAIDGFLRLPSSIARQPAYVGSASSDHCSRIR